MTSDTPSSLTVPANLGILGASLYGGFALSKSITGMMTQYEASYRAAAASQPTKNTTRPYSVLTPPDYTRHTFSEEMVKGSVADTPDYYTSTLLQATEKDPDYVKRARVQAPIFSMNDQLRIETLQRDILGMSPDTVNSALTKMTARQNGRTAKKFQTEYKIFDKLRDLGVYADLENITEDRDGYHVTIRPTAYPDAEQLAQRVYLPKIRNNGIMLHNRQRRGIPNAVMTGGQVIVDDIKLTLNRNLADALDMIKLQSRSQMATTQKIGRALASAISATFSNAEAGNSIQGDITRKILLVNNQYAYTNPASRASSEILSYYNQKMHRANLWTYDPDQHLYDTGEQIETGNTGESTKRRATGSRLGVGNFRQAQTANPFRPNFAHGVPTYGLTVDAMRAQFGVLPDGMAAKAKGLRETMPGGMSMLTFSDAATDNAKGSMTFYARKTTEDLANLARFTMTKPMPAVTILNTGEDTLAHIEQTVQAHLKHGGLMPKGTYLGMSTDLEKVYLDHPAYITGVEAKDGRTISISMSQPKSIRIGGKMGKTAIQKITTPGEETVVMKDSRKPGLRDYGTYLSSIANNQTDMAIGLGEMSKYNGGMRAVGFYHKILQDVMHNQIQRKLAVRQSLRSQDIASVKKTVKSVMAAIMPADAQHAFSDLHIVQDTRTGEHVLSLDLAPNVTPKSAPFMALHAFDQEMTLAFDPTIGTSPAARRGTQKSFFAKVGRYEKEIARLTGMRDYKVASNIADTTPRPYRPALVYGRTGSDVSLKEMTIFTPMYQHFKNEDDIGRHAGPRGRGGAKMTYDIIEAMESTGDTSGIHQLYSSSNREASYLKDAMHAMNSPGLVGSELQALIGTVPRSADMKLPVNAKLISFTDIARKGLMKELITDLSAQPNAAKLTSRLSELEQIVRQFDLSDDPSKAREIISSFQDVLSSGAAHDERLFEKLEGLRGKSSVVFAKTTVEHLLNDINAKGDTLYLELPTTVRVRRNKAYENMRAIPMSRIDQEAFIGLQAEEFIAPETTDMPTSERVISTVRTDYVTADAATNAQVKMMAEVALASHDVENATKKGEPLDAIQERLQRSIQQYYDTIAAQANGKNGSYVKKTFNRYAPYSGMTEMSYDPDLPHGWVKGSHDFLTNHVTQKRITSYSQAVADHAKFTALTDLKQQITAYQTGLSTAPDPEAVTKTVKNHVQTLTQDALKTSHKSYQVQKMSRAMVKQLRTAPLDVNATSAIIDREIEKTRMGEYAWQTINELPTMSEVRNGKVTSKGYLTMQIARFPVLDASAMAQARIVRDDVPEHLTSVSESAKSIIKSMGAPGADLLKQAGMKLSYGIDMAAQINGDFDGDIAAFWGRAQNYLKETAAKVGMSLQDIDKLGLTHVSRQTDIDAFTAMCKYHMMHKDETGTFRPTSPTSFSAMFDIAKAQEGEYLKYKSVNLAIDEHVDAMNISPTEKTTLRKELKQNMKATVKRPLGSLYLYNGRDEDKYVEYLQKTAPVYDPASLTESLFNGWSHAQFAQYQAVTTQEKQAYADAVIDYERRTAPRLNAMKKLTPDAYNLSKAFTALEPYLATDESRTFLHAFANKLVAQKAISMKHGTFPVVDDLKKLMSFSRADVPVDDGVMTRLASFDFEWTPKDPGSSKFVSTVKSVSGIADGADQSVDALRMHQYASYLEKKTTYLSSMLDIHTSLESQRVDMVTAGYSADHITAKYSDMVSDAMKAKRLDPAAGEIFDISAKGTTNAAFIRMQHIDAQEQFRNLKESMHEKHLVRNGAAGADPAFMRRNLDEIVSALKRHHQTTGYAPTEHPAIRMVRQFASDPEGDNVLYSMSSTDDAVVSNNVAERHLARTSAVLHQADTTIAYNTTEDVRWMDKNVRDAENRAIYRMKQSALTESSTPFRYGSMFDSLKGNLARAGVNASGDHMADVLIKHRGKLALVGLFVGAVASQAINTAATGYAAPGLGHINGKGGEYYEHHTRIIGTELEGILAPQPVRMVNQYRESLSMMQRVLTSQSAQGAYTGQPSAPAMVPAYKGVWV